MSEIRIPISVGELIDKLTILEIKSERIGRAGQLANVHRELEQLTRIWENSALSDQDIESARKELKSVNEFLWEIEDKIRLKEIDGVFDEGFIELARSVYVQNDRRAAIKRRINLETGSELVEEKSYAGADDQ
ncbi:MAG: DUF6165 family protein [Gammaproteobacteria bacterium]